MIDYKDVCIEREQQLLLRDVKLHISEGEFVYLIGKVGSGKSSLLKSLYAEVPIVGGCAQVFEYDLRSIKKSQIPYLRRRLGIIFQDFQLLVDRTVQQNLEFVLKATGWKDKREMENRINEVLKLVGMENKGYRMPNTLSGGEQQRVVIARALLNNPSVILADEPTGNLDPETGKNIVQLLYDICHQRNTAVLMSTHNLQLLEQFPGRIVQVEDGKVSESECLKIDPVEGKVDDCNTLEDNSLTDELSDNCPLEPNCEEPNIPVGVECQVEQKEEILPENPITEDPILEIGVEVISETSQDVQFETNKEVPLETQTDSTVDSDEENNVEDHCSPSSIRPEGHNCSGQSDQIPSVSAGL